MKRNEIGSEFWDVPLGIGISSLLPTNTEWYLSGRVALRAIIRALKHRPNIATVALPSWCCASMIRPFQDAGGKVVFYPVVPEAGGGLSCNFSVADSCDVLLMMDYFGYGSIDTPKGFSGIIVRDITHSVFTGYQLGADYYFGSLRKWAGFWTGGFAFKSGREDKDACPPAHGSYLRLREQAMLQKAEYINGVRSDKGFLSLFNQAEEMLDEMPVSSAAERDIQLANLLDVEGVRTKRRANAQRLLSYVKDIALFPEMTENDCPLFVPISLPQPHRDALRKHLISNAVYCPVHWPIESEHRLTPQTSKIYEEELSLVCDQRYTPEDMDRIGQLIKAYLHN